MQVQVQVGRCSSSNKRKGGGVSVSRVEQSLGSRRMRKACGTWKIPWNTPCATRPACVYILNANVSPLAGSYSP